MSTICKKKKIVVFPLVLKHTHPQTRARTVTHLLLVICNVFNFSRWLKFDIFPIWLLLKFSVSNSVSSERSPIQSMVVRTQARVHTHLRTHIFTHSHTT